MAQSSFSLTQTSEQSPDIFINASRLPLSVYLDVNPEIFSRPRLIRLLRTSGADICHNPSAASILLINPETESGRKFVHDWSTDPHKTVLNYGWIQACLRTGRALLETEEWGGFRVLHTSSCIYSEDEGDEDIENGCNGTRSLSTFRSNPTEGAVPPTFSSRSKPSLTPTRPKPRSPNRPSTIEQNVKLSTPSLAYHHPSSSVLEASDSLPAPSPQSKLASTVMLPSPRSGTGVNPQGTAACYHPAPAPRKHTPMGSDPSYLFPQVADIPPLTHLPSQVTGESKSQNSSLATNHPAPQQSPADSFNLLHALNSAFQFQNAASQTLTQLVETMITVAQRQGMDTAVIQNYLASLPMSSSLNHLTLSSTSQLSNTPDLTSSSLREQQEPSGLGTPSENLGQSSSSRPASYEQPLSGKRRRVSPDLPSQAKRVVHTPQLNQPDEASEPVRGVFSVKSGRPILVFVQIDTRGRHEIVHLIKVSPHIIASTL
ncbi:hypothetical protein B0F90DRAFT_1679023 [Multifurca ochricompacta]|uniref:BRCT domain-containing protein n=1 Tax=Multifurca ochricompacta TaxID=376703 RepID=A0AAD4QU50_9AGAM|nr:hypothetical protein B0F90DRAFT_1679023 [Multifurca ochricompacta]